VAQPKCPEVVVANDAGARAYERRRPERTLLYQLVREHLSTFLAEVESSGRSIPRYVRRAFDGYLSCGILAHGFARALCQACNKSLLVAFSCRGRGVCPSCGARRMYDLAARLVDRVIPDVALRQWVLTLPYSLRGLCAVRVSVLNAIAKLFVDEVFRWQREQVQAGAKLHGAAVLAVQRFGGSLNLAPHLHLAAADGVWDVEGRFEPTPRPGARDLELVAARVAKRAERWLRRHGFSFDESAPEREPDVEEQIAQASLRPLALATVDHAGRVTPLVARRPARRDTHKTKAVARGFDLHADVAVLEGDREGRERLCRYLLRPPLCLERLSLTSDGRVAYERKYKSAGASHIVMTPTQLLARLSALVFPPRRPILRYHGAFAANHQLRARIVPQAAAARAAPHVGPLSCSQALAAALAAPPHRPKPRRVRAEQPIAASNHTSTNTPNKPVAITPRDAPRTALGAVNKPLDWATLLKRVWSIDALACPCGGRLRFIAIITEPEPVADILVAMRLDSKPPARAPPRHADFTWEA
jgi:hypothetical protein